MKRELWVIDPSTHVAEGEGVGEFAALWTGEVRVFRPALEPEDFLGGRGYDCAGIVVLGSRASVHDSLDWLDDLKAWMSPLVNGEVTRPLLGVCFGHQLLAHLGGGTVGFLRDDESKLVSVETTTIAESGFFPAGGSFQVVCSHRERVHKVSPDVYKVTGHRREVPVDVIEHQSLPILGVQFHPEARMQFAAHCGLDLKPHLDEVARDGRRPYRRVSGFGARGAVSRLFPSIVFGMEVSEVASEKLRSQSWHVTSLCFWSSASQ